DAHGSRVSLDLALQRMRVVRQLGPRCSRGEVHEHATALHLQAVRRNRVGLEARLAEPRSRVELPVMPRTDNVLAVQRSLAERAGGVIADSRDGAESSARARDRDLGATTLHTGYGTALQIFFAAYIDPVLGHRFLLRRRESAESSGAAERR